MKTAVIFAVSMTIVLQSKNVSNKLTDCPSQIPHIITFFNVLAVAFALLTPQQEVVIVKETPLDNIGVDGYNYGYELSNGQHHEESAQLTNAGSENEVLAVRGSFGWVDPVTNQKYTVNYIADENGFHPQGEHLPSV
ncbi:flexible cuticle protein 12-like [Vespa mandarinia]|uniref:flexible cuticle protein 12-like n=1 Tax=Vespa mandarinia TaxID=7446 RepID=UPI00160D0235|nr:flexible cuticle protein 12-like [Vespa mandarinia]